MFDWITPSCHGHGWVTLYMHVYHCVDVQMVLWNCLAGGEGMVWTAYPPARVSSAFVMCVAVRLGRTADHEHWYLKGCLCVLCCTYG